MKNNNQFINLSKFMTYIWPIFSLLIGSTTLANAMTTDSLFTQISQFKYVASKNTSLLKLVNNPSNTQQYFIAKKSGELFFVDNMKDLQLIFDLNTNTAKNTKPINLTAFELHPNFSLRDQPGYNTFYTGHIELLDNTSSTKRIQESSDELVLNYDAVITEWKFHPIDNKKVNVKAKREVLRVAVPDHDISIKQISFSPYTKSWNDGFGLLYVALNGQKKWQKPLYSGVILRINPSKFGLRSFTVPMSNPYLNDSEIKDEIYLLGAQNIKQFIWANKSSDDILLSHFYNGRSLLSKTSKQNDWRGHDPEKIIYQSEDKVESVLLYRGSNLTHLRNKLLLLIKSKRNWFVESLNPNFSDINDSPVELKTQEEWQFTSAKLTNNSKISFSYDGEGEVLIFDKTVGEVYQIPQEQRILDSPSNKKDKKPKVKSKSTSSTLFIIILIILLSVSFYYFKRRKPSAKAIVRQNYAQIKLSESQQQIGFYHRHQSNVEALIDVKSISSFEIKLNNSVINIINQHADHGFSNDKEKDLRAIFVKEKVEKMVDGKIRQITLTIIDSGNKNYIVSLYMRKGSNRVTKKPYRLVVDDLIDWCWLIAEKINVNEIETRKVKPVKKIEPTTAYDEKKSSGSSLHEQRNLRDSTTDKVPESVTNVAAKPAETNVSIKMNDDTQKAGEVSETSNNKDAVDTSVVNALEKLVDLKQQGFLTQEEFTKAKENLLRNLFDE